MSLALDTDPRVSATSQTIAMSQLLTVTTAAPNPAYLYLNATDIDAYTPASTGLTGFFTGNGHQLQLAASSSNDVRQAGLLFTYDPARHQYVNPTYGNLADLTFTASSSADDVTDISIFATNSSLGSRSLPDNVLALVTNADGNSLGSNMFVGSTTVATTTALPAPITSERNATPSSIAAVAQTFVGQRWDADGCWVLGSTIAALAGASLPVTAITIGPGLGNGEWFAAYRGATAPDSSWQSLVRTGDIVAFMTTGNTAHVTTCVSGAGSSAMLVDNASIGSNDIGDGSNDLNILAAHPADQEFDGTDSRYVTIYRLDTPIVTATATATALGPANTLDIQSNFAAADPTGKAIARYELRTGKADDLVTVAGTPIALTSTGCYAVASLAGLSLVEQSITSFDTIDVRANNGIDWGDWTEATLSLDTAAPIATTTASTNIPLAAATPGTTQPIAAPQTPQSQSTTDDAGPIYRFFDTRHGTQFLTASSAERDQLIGSRPDLAYEGTGMGTVAANPADPNVATVFRFFSQSDGTHFFTTSASERDTIVATRADLVLETATFSEHATPQPGDIAVYRFFDSTNGSHFFTSSTDEMRSIAQTRPDMVAEAVAFYAPNA